MVAPRKPKTGDVIDGKYRLEQLIGEGGMGQVYRAMHLILGRAVAVKLMPLEHIKDERLVQRFLQEAHAAAKVRHRHIVEVLDAGTRPDGTPYIVQELLEGETLDKLMEARGGRLDPLEALSILLPITDAVAALHEANVLHRDIKPENMFLAQVSGQLVPKLLDFGISRELESGIRLTTTGTAMGTPAYMSPEQVNGKKTLDARSDVWSLGVVLYELIAGALPFTGETAPAMFAAIANSEPSPLEFVAPQTPTSIVKVVSRCLQRHIDSRYGSARELEDALNTAHRRLVREAQADKTLIDETPPHSVPTLDFPPPPATRPKPARASAPMPAARPQPQYDPRDAMMLGRELPNIGLQRGGADQSSGLMLDHGAPVAPRRAPVQYRAARGPSLQDALGAWYVGAAILSAVTAILTAVLSSTSRWQEAPAVLGAITTAAMDTTTIAPRVFAGTVLVSFSIFAIASVSVWPRAAGRTIGYLGVMLMSAVWSGLPVASLISTRPPSELVAWGATIGCVGAAIDVMWRGVEWWANGRMRVFPVLFTTVAAGGFWCAMQVAPTSPKIPFPLPGTSSTTTVVPTIDLTQSHTPPAR